MANSDINWVWKIRGILVAERMLLLCLSDMKNSRSEFCNPSHKRIAFECDLSRRYIQELLAKLTSMGLISIQKRGRKSGGDATNSYRLNNERFFPVSKESDSLLAELKKATQRRSSELNLTLMGGFLQVFLEKPKGLLWLALASESHEKFLEEHREFWQKFLIDKFGMRIVRFPGRPPKRVPAVRLGVIRAWTEIKPFDILN